MRKLALTILIAAAWTLLPAQPALAGSCSAWQDCSDGSTVDCSGSSSCIVGSDYVECDGTRTSCPQTICDVSLICPSPPYSSAWYIQCSASNSSETCETGTDYIRCGNTYKYCDDCESGKQLCLAAN